MNQPSLIPFDPLCFPLNGRRLIEASAGTGKTYSIASLYVRLVLGHGQDNDAENNGECTRFIRALMPPDILVVTFTEAATFELRARIRQKLAAAARVFRQQTEADAAEDVFLHSLRQTYAESDWPSLALRLEQAADWMDEAAIYTIHGFSKRVLQQHAVESGSPFAQTLAEDALEPLLGAVRDYWRQFYYPLSASQSNFIRRHFRDPDALAEKLQAVLAEGVAARIAGQPLDSAHTPLDLLADWQTWHDRQQEREQTARDAWLTAQTEAEACVREALAQGDLKLTSYKNIDDKLEQVRQWADDPASDTDKARSVLRLFAFTTLTANQKKVGKPISRLPVFDQFDLMLDGWSSEPAIELAQLLGHAREWVAARLQQQKEEQGVWQFDDLLVRLNQALQAGNGPALAQAIRHRHPVALIDEFQDTDAIQYDNFDRIYSADDCALFMVGDPKQAIYSFRGGDIHTYLRAREACAPHHYTLDMNYRSTWPMVEAVNALFTQAETLWPDGAFALPGKLLPFHAVRAQDKPAHLHIAGALHPALTFWQLQEGQTVQVGTFRTDMARRTAAFMAGLLQPGRAVLGDQPVQAGDMAVLVRNKTEADAMRQALTRVGLRSVYLSERGSVYETAEAMDVLRWLEACAEPARESLVRAALASPTLQRTLAELDTLFADPDGWQDELAFWRGLQGLWQSQGVMPMLTRLLDHYGVAVRLYALTDGERRLTNVLHLLELLQQAETEIRGEQTLLRQLRQSIRHPQGDSKAALMRLESDAELVKVVTLHKSKGLQYPLVFMPFAVIPAEEAGSKGKTVRYYADRQRIVELEPDDTARQAAGAEQLQEALRVLYVGLTRAEHALWLGIGNVRSGNDKKHENHVYKTALGYLLGGGAELDNAGVQQAIRARVNDAGPAAMQYIPAPDEHTEKIALSAGVSRLPPARTMRRQLGRLPRWWIASYSALMRSDAHATEAETARQDKMQSDTEPVAQLSGELAGELGGLSTFPAGARYGNLLHELLEAAALQGFARVAQDSSLLAQPLQRAREQLSAWQAGGGDELEGWLQAFLNTPLQAYTDGMASAVAFRLADLPAAHYQAEMEFWLSARSVDATALDAEVSRHTLGGLPRHPVPSNLLNGMLKGFMDLVAQIDGRYYVIDYKSNRLNGYSVEHLRDAVLQHRYELQYCLYLVALHRLLQSRLPDYDYDRHIGGALYIFLRGNAVHFERPPRALIEQLDRLLAGGRT